MFLLVAVFAVGMVFSGCAQPTAPEPTTPEPTTPEPTTPEPLEPVKIGHLLSLTGGLAYSGSSVIAGAETKLEEVDWTVAGRPVSYVYGDDGSNDPVKALDSVKRMVEVDHVDVILGPTVDGVFFAVQPYLEENGVLNISHCYRSTLYEWEPGKPRWDASIATSGQLAYTMGTYAYEEMGIRTIATLGHDYEGGWQNIDGFIDAFTKAGGTVVQQQWAPWGTLDFGPYFASLKDADATVAWLVGDMLPLFIKQYHEFGYFDRQPVVLASWETLNEDTQLEELGDMTLGIVWATNYASRIDSPANSAFVESIVAKTGVLPENYHAGGYEAVATYIAAVEATGGDTDPAAVREALMDLTLEVPAGEMIFTEKGYAIRDIFITEVQKIDGKLRWEVIKTVKNVPNPDPGLWFKP